MLAKVNSPFSPDTVLYCSRALTLVSVICAPGIPPPPASSTVPAALPEPSEASDCREESCGLDWAEHPTPTSLPDPTLVAVCCWARKADTAECSCPAEVTSEPWTEPASRAATIGEPSTLCRASRGLVAGVVSTGAVSRPGPISSCARAGTVAKTETELNAIKATAYLGPSLILCFTCESRAAWLCGRPLKTHTWAFGKRLTAVCALQCCLIFRVIQDYASSGTSNGAR